MTPTLGEEGIKPSPALRVSAHVLNCLQFLIEEPIPALAPHRSGSRVPSVSQSTR